MHPPKPGDERLQPPAVHPDVDEPRLLIGIAIIAIMSAVVPALVLIGWALGILP